MEAQKIIWEGGEHPFLLTCPHHVIALQEACGLGIAEIWARLTSGAWNLAMIRETIRLGLIGGGMSGRLKT
jgi:hypothetical protein